MKRCRTCHETIPLTEFYRHSYPGSRSADGYGYRCKPCDRAYFRKRYREKNHVPESRWRVQE